VAGLASHPFTKAVTSTRRKDLAVLTGIVANGLSVVGAVANVTEPSVHEEVTCEKVSVPGVVTAFTKMRR
jgi:L-aminopeptidase/D-esterase-like protein